MHGQLCPQFKAGARAKKSATYVDGLACALAEVMAQGVRRLLDFDLRLEPERTGGLESQIVNEACLLAHWRLDSTCLS